MAKKMKKLMVLGLALILCIMQIAVPALAEDGTVVEKTSDGLTVTTTTTTTDDGNGVITVTIEKTTEGTTDAGVKVEAEESKTTTTEGNTTTTEISGEEIRTEDIEDSGDEPGQPEVTVDLVPGATTEATADKTTVEGDAPADENDENYDYTETTETERTVTAETSEIKTSYNEIESGLVGNQETELKGLAPVYDVIDGVKEDKGGVFDYQYNNCLSNKYSNPETWVGENAMPEEADVRFLGTGEHTKYYAASVYAIYEKDEEGNTVYDENGKPVIKELWTYDPEVYGSSAKLVTLNGEPVTELPEGYEYAGTVSEEMGHKTGNKDIPFYTKDGSDDFYTYQMTGTYIGGNMIDNTKQAFHYIQWIPIDEE